MSGQVRSSFARTGRLTHFRVYPTLRRKLAESVLRPEARVSGAKAMVARLKLLIAKLRHEQFGASSERGRKLLDQLEL
jgi:hypothetical protein